MSIPYKTIILNEQKKSNPKLQKNFELNNLCMIDL